MQCAGYREACSIKLSGLVIVLCKVKKITFQTAKKMFKRTIYASPSKAQLQPFLLKKRAAEEESFNFFFKVFQTVAKSFMNFTFCKNTTTICLKNRFF